MTLTTFLTLQFWQLKDNLRHAKISRSLNAIRHYLIAMLEGGNHAATRLAAALGFSEHAAWDQTITKALIKRFPAEDNEALWSEVARNLPRYQKLLHNDPQLTRTIILKAPGRSGEKGVMLMYFEYNWARLALGLSKQDFDWIDTHYDLVLSTSWSPTDYALLAALVAKCSGPLFIQPCNRSEAAKLTTFHPRLHVLDSLPCDWIDPSFYPANSKTTRDIDFLMVANWGDFKRHWDFFLALKELPPELKIVLVGQAEAGRDANYIRELARKIGVPQDLEIYQSLPIDLVTSLQMRSKVSLIFTRREGCCVAAVESLFAGCALGMRTDAHIGPLNYINEQTGLQLRPGHLPQDLLRLLELSVSLTPARWARSHVSCHQTHAALNTALRESSLRRGLPWTKDIALPHWRPYPKHARKADAQELSPCYQELHQRFPQVFSGDLIKNSIR